MARLFSKNLHNNFGNFWRTFRERRLQGGRRDGKIGKNERRRGYDLYNERVFSAGDAGDCVLLVSDGVTTGKDDRWLRKLLSEFDGLSPQALAAQILKESDIRSGSGDDRTVIAVKLDVRT